MGKKQSREIVVDTDIIRSAGGTEASNPTSKDCRDFLSAILNICHCVVITDHGLAEWRAHRSRYSHRWLTEMYGRRKVKRLDNDTLESNYEQIIEQIMEVAAKMKMNIN